LVSLLDFIQLKQANKQTNKHSLLIRIALRTAKEHDEEGFWRYNGSECVCCASCFASIDLVVPVVPLVAAAANVLPLFFFLLLLSTGHFCLVLFVATIGL
jgi:hypothetical protein